jgi:Imm-5 like putative immunity protein
MVTVANETSKIVLSMQDLREVTGYAAESAQGVLEIFESAHPADPRPRDAIDAAWTFARGGERGKTLRDTAWAALKAARDANTAAAGDAARAAMCAASAAYLHPLANAHQVKHILGAAAHAARAAELTAGDDRDVGADHIERARRRATPVVVDVLSRYPAAPPGGGRVGELLRDLDGALRVRCNENEGAVGDERREQASVRAT